MDRDFFCMHSALCKTLASRKRQMILAALRDGELSFGDLVTATDTSPSNLSQHLTRMREHGVVRVRREGVRTYYAVTNPKLFQAFDLITEVLQESMDERARAAESETEEAAQWLTPLSRLVR